MIITRQISVSTIPTSLFIGIGQKYCLLQAVSGSGNTIYIGGPSVTINTGFPVQLSGDAFVRVDMATGEDLWAVTDNTANNLIVCVLYGSGSVEEQGTSAFGVNLASSLQPVVVWSFLQNYLNTRIITSTFTGSGSLTLANSEATIKTGAATSSSAQVQSKRLLRYVSGVGARWKGAGFFSTGKAGSTQMLGIGNTEDGFMFGYNGTQFGVNRRINSVDNWTPQSSWNVDKFDGTGISGQILDTTKGNIYGISYQWLGYGRIRFFIQNSLTGHEELVHSINFSNTSVTPSVNTPSLPLLAKVLNTTNNTNVQMTVGSAAGFIEGEFSAGTDISWGAEGSKTNITTETSILTIRNNLTFNGLSSHAMVKITGLSSHAMGTGANPYTVRLKLNSTLGGVPSFTNINANSHVSFDTAGTTVTGGALLFSRRFPRDNGDYINLIPNGLFLVPGETLTASVESATNIDPHISLTWSEED